jgi:hypothetical protein
VPKPTKKQRDYGARHTISYDEARRAREDYDPQRLQEQELEWEEVEERGL